MTPAAAAFLVQAHRLIDRAERMLVADLNEDAARTAYLACFHVAQAYIFERTDRVAKTHHGVQTEFFRLTREDRRSHVDLRRFLSQAYEFKSIADYHTGEEAITSAGDARDAVATATSFVSHFEALV